MLSIMLPVAMVLVIIFLFLAYYFYLSSSTLTIQLEEKAEELKSIQRILQNKQEEVETYIESNIRLSQFAYIASHDLKASLNTIKTFSNLLKTTIGDSLAQKEEEYFSYIEKAAATAEASVIDTLYFAQIKSIPLHLKKVPLSKIFNELLGSLKDIINKRQAVIQLNKMPKIIIADEKQIMKVFEALLSNAIKFTPDDRTPFIQIFSKELEQEWLFSISDNGIGIKAKNHKKIFDEFIKLNNTYKYSGSGFGLPIGKNIIEKHGGKIWIEASSDAGTTFAFTIKK